MSDLDRLAEVVREWQESGLVPGKEADAVLNVAPELIAVARAQVVQDGAVFFCRTCCTSAAEERHTLACPVLAALAKLREVFGDE